MPRPSCEWIGSLCCLTPGVWKRVLQRGELKCCFWRRQLTFGGGMMQKPWRLAFVRRDVFWKREAMMAGEALRHAMPTTVHY